MKFSRYNNGTAMQSHVPCWTETRGKMITFLDESSLLTKPGLPIYETNLKRQSNEWKLPGFPRPKKVHSTKCAVNVMFIVAYDADGVILYHVLPPRQTVNAAYYCTFLQHHLRPRSGENDDTWWYRIPSFCTNCFLFDMI